MFVLNASVILYYKLELCIIKNWPILLYLILQLLLLQKLLDLCGDPGEALRYECFRPVPVWIGKGRVDCSTFLDDMDVSVPRGSCLRSDSCVRY